MLGENLTRALREAWAAVGVLGLPAAVMGGVALTTWLHPRMTHDVDLLIGSGGKDPDDLLRAMQVHGFRPLHFPAWISVGPARFLQLQYTPPGTFVDVKVDLLLAETEYQQTALSRRRRFDWPELSLCIETLSCEDLIVFKLLAQRVIDRADVIYVIIANRAILDYSYLGHWLNRLDLRELWSECWGEACPDEPDPTVAS